MDDAQCILLGVSAGLVLDGRIYSADAVFRVPAFHLNTAAIEAAHVMAPPGCADTLPKAAPPPGPKSGRRRQQKREW